PALLKRALVAGRERPGVECRLTALLGIYRAHHVPWHIEGLTRRVALEAVVSLAEKRRHRGLRLLQQVEGCTQLGVHGRELEQLGALDETHIDLVVEVDRSRALRRDSRPLKTRLREH